VSPIINCLDVILPIQSNSNLPWNIYYYNQENAYARIQRPNIKQQNTSIWCIVDTPNLLWEPPKVVVSNNLYTILKNNGYKPTWLVHLVIIHTTYIANLLELWLMMDPLEHSHVESDIVHNFAHGFSILDYPNLPTMKPHNKKTFAHK
jgi:hypothetical protein